MKTYAPKPRDIERRWYVVDAEGAVLGRLASEVAKILRGKHKPIYAPHADTGDHVIVVNAAKVRVTGGKESEKVYWRHSGYPGGITGVRYDRLLTERPSFAVEKAIRGMLPKNRLGRQMIGKLAVYDGAEHPHAAQQPKPLRVGEVPEWAGLPAPAPPKPKREAATPPPRRAGSARPASGRASARSAGKAAAGKAAAPRAGAASRARTARASAGAASKPKAGAAPKPKSRAKKES